MKRLLLTLTISLLAASGFAQERKGYIGLGLGPSFANGDFAENFNNSGSGYAKTGVAIDMSAGYQFSRFAGVMALFKSQLNGYDTKSAFPGVEAETNGWLSRAFMAGPYASVPLGGNRKAFLEGRALMGFCKTRSPEVTRIEISSMGASKAILQSEKANSLGLVAGLGLRVPFSDRIELGLHADYFWTKPEFDYPTIPNAPIQQTITLLNTSVSFSYRFMNVLESRTKPGLLENGTF